LLQLRSGITRSVVGMEEINVESISKSNSVVVSRQSSFNSNNRWKELKVKVGVALSVVLASIALDFVAADKCWFSSDCGGCRSIYLKVGSGDRFDTQQGPTLLYEPEKADFKWGRVCGLFTP